MSDFSNEISPLSTQRNCECYKKLETLGIPLYISDENDLYAETRKKITYENAYELPGSLEINESITEYLIVEDNELFNVFNHMAEVIPKLSNFEENVLNFWMLDIFIEGLWTAQNAKMNFNHQKATLLWIAYLFNYIQRHNPTRRDLFDHLKIVLFQIECQKTSEDSDESGESNQKIGMGKEPKIQDVDPNGTEGGLWKLPLPPNLYESPSKLKHQYDEIKIPTSEEQSVANESIEEQKSLQSLISDHNDSENDSLTNLNHTKVILDILYRIFGRLWVYIEIQTVFHAMPPVKQVDLPFILNIPKPPLKPGTPVQPKTEKFSRRPTYLEKSFEEVESEKQLRKNDFILPLQAAEESKLLLKQLLPSSQRSVLGRRKT